MKKSIIFTVLIASLLTACVTNTTGKPSKITAKVETQATLLATSTTKGEDNQNTVSKVLAEVEQQEIFNQDGIKVTVKGFDQDSSGPYLNVLVENDSDRNIVIQTKNSSLNGYMIDFLFSCDVAPGKKANDKILMDLRSIDLSGIGKIYDIDFDLVILDDNFSTIAENNNIHIDRNLSEPYTQTYDDSGTLVYDRNNIRIIWKDFGSDDTFSALLLYIENNSSDEITVQVRDTSVNGFMVNPTMSSDVLPGKKVVDAMSFYNSDLDLNGITDIKEIETRFDIFKSDFTKNIEETDLITFTIN